VAPHTAFQDGIPDKPAPGVTTCGIPADSRRLIALGNRARFFIAAHASSATLYLLFQSRIFGLSQSLGGRISSIRHVYQLEMAARPD
jgi:hypothetical protein